ncbi:MAG: hypothetical protein EOO56_00495 [Hymenobacter sp.]|nr:MAG: hypothetical protein EOO56_00495 [Hymenobacter sp.]
MVATIQNLAPTALRGVQQTTAAAVLKAMLQIGYIAAMAWWVVPLTIFFLKDESVVPLMRVWALGFILVGLEATATSLLRREMRFKAIFKVEVLAHVRGGGGITLAQPGLGWLRGLSALLASTQSTLP